MRTMRLTGARSAAAALVLLCASGAEAGLVNFTVSGDVNFALFGNPFGLNTGDTVTASGVFDDSVLSGGSGTVSFNDPGNSMTLTIGGIVYTDVMDVFGGADITLGGGSLVSFDYGATAGVNGAIADFQSNFLNFGSGAWLVGTWDAASFQMTPVPVPAAFWLFGSGLLGLVAQARKRRKA